MFSIQVGSSTFRHFLVFGGQPFGDVMDWLAAASIGIRNASRNRNIERRKPVFPFLNQTNSLAQNFTARVVATRFYEVGHICFKVLSEICAACHANTSLWLFMAWVDGR
jgi:hypothetical protein